MGIFRRKKGEQRQHGRPLPAEGRKPDPREGDPRARWTRSTQWRLLVVPALPIVLLAASTAVSGYLQLHRRAVFQREAERNYVRNITLDDTRGQILDRNGELLATSVDVESIFADPKLVEHPERSARLLAEALELSPDDVYERLTRPTRFVYLKRKVSNEESERVAALQLPGIYHKTESERFAPKKDLAGQVIGVVGLEHHGLEGIEAAFDRMLRGESAIIPALRDTLGRTTFAEDIPRIPRFAGNSVVLTIDENIQAQTEAVLERAVIFAGASTGMAVVMDVHTGELLALAHVPRFNPNNYKEFDKDRRRARTITDVFEPGSVFKVFTLAAALDLNAVQLDEVFDCEWGKYRVGGHIINDVHPYGKLSVLDILSHSSNIGFTKIGARVGPERLYHYLTAFGFGQRPGLDLEGEATGLLWPPKVWADITFANICFGQGISASALQLVRGMAAIGNRGVLVQPMLVKEVRDSNGTPLVRYQPKEVRRALPEATSRRVLKALRAVVGPNGTGKLAASERFDLVGKTGTAQKPDNLLGGYSKYGWVGSFLGTGPVEDPRIAVIVVIDEPLGKGYGGVVAAPAFREIAEWTLDYLGVQPTREFVHRTSPVHAGAGTLVAPSTPPAAPSAPASDGVTGAAGTAEASADPNAAAVVPDFHGMTMTRVRDMARAARLDARVFGEGQAAAQSPAAGTLLVPWSPVDVVFRPEGAEEAASGAAPPSPAPAAGGAP